MGLHGIAWGCIGWTELWLGQSTVCRVLQGEIRQVGSRVGTMVGKWARNERYPVVCVAGIDEM